MDKERRNKLFKRLNEVTPSTFNQLALDLFAYQKHYNPIYKAYLKGVHRFDSEPQHYTEIPALPIRFYKYHTVKTGEWKEEQIFQSSGTTGQQFSSHYIRSLNAYYENSVRGFTNFFGPPDKYCFLALLPSYLERENASLVFMVRHFMELSQAPENGFFLDDFAKLRRCLLRVQEQKQPTVLVGVSFALLEFAEKCPLNLSGVKIMETGGMKGRGRELIRTEFHSVLKETFNVEKVYSEYGMTELMSQAYSRGEGIFQGAPTLRIWARPVNDPLGKEGYGRTGVLNAVDLSNIDTCCFIATEDLGRVFDENRFEVLGRIDGSEWRGCNLMYLPE